MHRRIDLTIRFVAEAGGDGMLTPLFGEAVEGICLGEFYRGKEITVVRPDGEHLLVVDAELLNYTQEYDE